MQNHKILLKSRLVLLNENKVLLMHQTSNNGGKYTLPGGTVEDNEFAKLALIREVLEETGILVDYESLKMVHVLHKKKGTNTRMVLYFKADKWVGKPISRELTKFKEVDWFELNNLPKTVSPTVKYVLEQIGQGITYSEFSKK